MPFSDSLEVGIGLSFIFFLSSLVLASIHEMIEIVTKTRGKYLFDGIAELLDDPKLPRKVTAPATGTPAAAQVSSGQTVAETIYQHPVIRGLMKGDITKLTWCRRNLPSYIPTKSFVTALLDQVAQGMLKDPTSKGVAPASASRIQQLRMMAEGVENQQVRTALIHAIDSAQGDIDTLRDSIEHWFDSAMDRVSGWYKRRSQIIIFVLGLGTAGLLNINTIVIAQSLSTSPQLRQAVINQAAQAEGSWMSNCANPANKGQAGCSDTTASGAIQELDRTDVPLGWTGNAIAELRALADDGTGLRRVFGWFEIISGYFLTAFAVTLGAPFWFDVLNRLMVIRATVKPTEKSPDEASQDPQPASATPAPVIKILPAQQQGQDKPPAPPLNTGANIYLTIIDASQRLFETDFKTNFETKDLDAGSSFGADPLRAAAL
jgi:hypothetical protein